MKKLFAIFLAVCIFNFYGCSKNSQESTLPSSSDIATFNPTTVSDASDNLELPADTTIINTNPFFFSSNVQSVDYNAKFSFIDNSALPNTITLSVNQILALENGILYELKLDYQEEFNGRIYYGWDRFHLGYFYVQEDKIYLVRNLTDIDDLRTEADIINQGTIICQKEEQKDVLAENEKGLHEYILLKGNQCEYHSYNNLTETGFYELFVWEQGKGLVKYRSGFGAEKDGMELQLIQ